jgi:hypothetical protein
MRERKREVFRFFRFSRFSEKSFRFPRIVFREQISRLEIREEKNITSRLVLGNGNGKTMVFKPNTTEKLGFTKGKIKTQSVGFIVTI